MKIPKQISFKKASVIFLVMAFLFSSGITYVLAQTPSQTFWIAGGGYPGATGYTIEKDGSNYFAKNHLGQISFSGTNASEIMQNSIDDLYGTGGAGGTFFGGTVFVRKSLTGDYAINTALIMRDRVDFIGEKDATLVATQNLVPSIISLDYDSNTAMNMKISGFRLEGNSSCNYGVSIHNVYGKIMLDDMEILSCLSAGVYFKGAWGVTIRQTKITAPSSGYGIRMERAVTGQTTNSLNTFKYVFIQGDGTGVQIKGDAVGNTFFKCHFTTDTRGVQILGNGTYKPILTHILDSWFERGAAATTERGIEVTDVSPFTTQPEQTIIENNHFGVYDIAIFLQYAKNTTIKNNYYASITTDDINIAATAEDTTIEGGGWSDAFIGDSGNNTKYEGMGFEESGNNEASNGDWVSHYLFGAPTSLLLTVFETDANYFVQLQAVNSTHFQIYLYDHTAGAVETVDKTICWYAEYQP